MLVLNVLTPNDLAKGQCGFLAVQVFPSFLIKTNAELSQPGLDFYQSGHVPYRLEVATRFGGFWFLGFWHRSHILLIPSLTPQM